MSDAFDGPKNMMRLMATVRPMDPRDKATLLNGVAEIERLERELATLQREALDASVSVVDMERITAERDDAIRALSETQRDAERYRWLKSRPRSGDFVNDAFGIAMVFGWPATTFSASLDADVDAAEQCEPK